MKLKLITSCHAFQGFIIIVFNKFNPSLLHCMKVNNEVDLEKSMNKLKINHDNKQRR